MEKCIWHIKQVILNRDNVLLLVVAGCIQLRSINSCNININRSPSNIPPLVVPMEVFVNIANLIGAEVNRGLSFLQDVATEGNMKQFLVVFFS